MNYSYKMIKNDIGEITIIEEHKNNDYSSEPEVWFIRTFISYSYMWKGNKSFYRTKKWVLENYPELMI